MDGSLCLLSGGLDSSASLALSLEAGSRVDLALTFHYGQRAATQEIASAAAIAKHFRIPHRVIELPWFRDLAQGGLTRPQTSMPKLSAAELDDAEVTRKTADTVWVPNRNGVFIEVAACLAEDLRIGNIIVGFNREEAATFPDNSSYYLEAINRALEYSTRGKTRVVSPTLNLSKVEIVRKISNHSFPFSLLWSCYEAGTKMCGECESCQRLRRGLKNAEIHLGGLFANELRS